MKRLTIMEFCVILLISFANLLTKTHGEIDCAKIPGDGKLEIEDCCKIPPIFDEKMIDECEKLYEDELPSSEASDDVEDMPIGSCAAECVMNRTQLLIKGKIDHGAMTKKINEAFATHKDFQSIGTTILTKCFKEIEKSEAEIDKAFLETGSKDTAHPGIAICNPKSTVFVVCLYSYLMAQCPDSAMNKSKENINSQTINGYDCAEHGKDINYNTIGMCCNSPPVFDQKILDDCKDADVPFYDSLGISYTIDQLPLWTPCESLCVIKDAQIMGSNNLIENSSFANLLNNAFANDENFTLISQEIVSDSLETAEENRDWFTDMYTIVGSSTGDACNPWASVFLTRVFTKIVANCPESAINSSNTECPGVIEFLNTCYFL